MMRTSTAPPLVDSGCAGDGSVMSFSRYGMSMLGIMGLFAATLAAATIWLVLTGPVTVPDAVTEEDITPPLQRAGQHCL